MAKRILLLGAGMVTRPLVRYLLDNPEFQVTISTRTVSKTQLLRISAIEASSDVDVPAANVEAMALGPPLADGRPTLILVSNNVDGSAQTQFLAFAVGL